MIAKFFSKSNPIHFVIIAVVLFLVFSTIKIHYGEGIAIDIWYILKQIALLGIVLFSVFILDFLVSKNKLTKKNSYQILFFALFCMLIPQVFLKSNLLLANLLVLFALRRIISLRSKKHQKKKILDAAIWISLATLLYFWSGLFFVLIFAALFLYKISDIKNWFIPLIGILLVAVITYASLIVLNISLTDYTLRFNTYISFDFSSLNQRNIIIGATILFSYFLWSLFYYLNNLKNKSKSYRPSYLLVLFAALIAFVIVIIAPNKSGSEFIFVLAPLAIIVTNYVELISEKWFKEVLIWILIVASLANLIL
ncbi:DUF6427 family protein [Hanstruepera flava]|uniref:DUF6427 family protein n=1 Tax=Hanstruepera flava TaxID=2930218 RepID=UPI00202932A9|nr:DUF6427 family protein [Hanstruepera flava]